MFPKPRKAQAPWSGPGVEKALFTGRAREGFPEKGSRRTLL